MDNNGEITRKIHFVVPAKRKRKRNYKLIRSYGNGDDIIEISKPKERSKLANANEPLLPKIILRRIICVSPDGKEYILFTSVVDENINNYPVMLVPLGSVGER